MSPLQILQRKAKFASDILTMYDTVCPGMTKERGLTLFEIFSATFQMIKLQASNIMNGVTDAASNSGAPKLLLKLFLFLKFIIYIVLVENTLPYLNIQYTFYFQKKLRMGKMFL